MTLGVCVCVRRAATARRVGGEGNALYTVLSSFTYNHRLTAENIWTVRLNGRITTAKTHDRWFRIDSPWSLTTKTAQCIIGDGQSPSLQRSLHVRPASDRSSVFPEPASDRRETSLSAAAIGADWSSNAIDYALRTARLISSCFATTPDKQQCTQCDAFLPQTPYAT